MEVSIGRPEFTHTVLAEQCGDVGIVHDVAGGAPGTDEVPKVSTVTRPLAEENDGGRVEQLVEILEGHCELGRGLEHPRVGDNAQKFIDARPWNRPRTQSFGQLRKQVFRLSMMNGFVSTGVDEEVRVVVGEPAAARVNLRRRRPLLPDEIGLRCAGERRRVNVRVRVDSAGEDDARPVAVVDAQVFREVVGNSAS